MKARATDKSLDSRIVLLKLFKTKYVKKIVKFISKIH